MAKKLEKAYCYYNKRYFNNELPFVPVMFSSTIWKKGSRHQSYGQFLWNCDTETGEYHDLRIFIASWLKPYANLWRTTLLHEMCHVCLRLVRNNHSKRHGAAFHAEMLRLAQAGAFRRYW